MNTTNGSPLWTTNGSPLWTTNGSPLRTTNGSPRVTNKKTAKGVGGLFTPKSITRKGNEK